MQKLLIDVFHMHQLFTLTYPNTCANAFSVWWSHEVLWTHMKTSSVRPWTTADTHINSSSASSPSSASSCSSTFSLSPLSNVAVWHGMRLQAIWETRPTVACAWVGMLPTTSGRESSANRILDRTRLEPRLSEDARWRAQLLWLLDLLKLSRRTLIRCFRLLSAPQKDGGSSAPWKRKTDFSVSSVLLPIIHQSVGKKSSEKDKRGAQWPSPTRCRWPAVAFTIGEEDQTASWRCCINLFGSKLLVLSNWRGWAVARWATCIWQVCFSAHWREERREGTKSAAGSKGRGRAEPVLAGVERRDGRRSGGRRERGETDRQRKEQKGGKRRFKELVLRRRMVLWERVSVCSLWCAGN